MAVGSSSVAEGPQRLALGSHEFSQRPGIFQGQGHPWAD